MERIGPPTTLDEFHQRLMQMRAELPPRLRQCADHVVTQGPAVAVSTVAEVAAGAGVPPSAVMRFSQILGFSGYSEMQRLFRDAVAPRWPDYAARLAALTATGRGSAPALFAEFAEAGRLSLERAAETLHISALEQAVEALSAARLVHLVGLRRALPVASYLAYLFEKLGVAAMLHDRHGGLDHRAALGTADALVAISYAPYSEETLALAEAAFARGLPVIALTDGAASPLARRSHHVLTVPEGDFGDFRSLTASLVLAQTLAVAVGSRRKAA